MTLTIARFDLDETPREPNTHRPTPVWSPLPVGFPFLVDKDTSEVNAPALSFLVSKCARPDSYSNGRWAKQRTADNYAADLKDWWAEVEASSHPWHDADEENVAPTRWHWPERMAGSRMPYSSSFEGCASAP